jgi:hypothetical protein
VRQLFKKQNKTMKKINFFTTIIVFISFFACKQNEPKTINKVVDNKTENIAANAPQIVDSTAEKKKQLINHSLVVLDMLMRNDYAALSSEIAPDGKLLFSPYGFIDTSEVQQFTPALMAKMNKSKQKIVWGTQDGTGDKIKMTAKDYFNRYVVNKMYMKADTIRANQSVKIGNSINNVAQIFPNCDYVEYFCKGTEQYGEADWGILRLVYKTISGKKYLVAVIHDEWTS